MGACLGPEPGRRISENHGQTNETSMIFKVPGVRKIQKTHREVISRRKLAARASWETPGIDVGAMWGSCWVQTSVRKGVRKRGEIWNDLESL